VRYWNGLWTKTKNGIVRSDNFAHGNFGSINSGGCDWLQDEMKIGKMKGDREQRGIINGQK
jgi:hypothetical protein